MQEQLKELEGKDSSRIQERRPSLWYGYYVSRVKQRGLAAFLLFSLAQHPALRGMPLRSFLLLTVLRLVGFVSPKAEGTDGTSALQNFLLGVPAEIPDGPAKGQP